MFILIDNYDSFTWNLWHFLSDLGAQVEIVRNDAATPDEVLACAPQGLVLSPGPRTPQDAGITIELIRAATGNTPVLGVCLGHQALAAIWLHAANLSLAWQLASTAARGRLKEASGPRGPLKKGILGPGALFYINL